jgi:hypothetical protein
MQAGDIIGPWIFEDLQKGLKALKYTLLEISWERGELDNFQQGSGEGSDIAAAIADAVANAAWSLAADYPPLAWTSLYNTASSPVYSGFNRCRQYATVHMPGGCDLGGDFDLYLMGALQGDQYGASGQAILEGLLSLFGTVASPGSQIMVGDFDLSAFDWPTEDVYVGYEVDASSFYLAKWSFTNA